MTTKIRKILEKIHKRDLVLPVAIMGGLLVITLAVTIFLNRAERITVNEPMYQFNFEEADRYPNGISMKKSKDGLTVNNGVQQYETNGYPYYYENRKALILTDSFLYLNQGGTEDGRVDYFTTISENNGRYLLEDGRNVTLGGGLLHDGKDVFLFLEKATVSYNGKTKEIGPLSYVACFQGESILICNYGENAILEDLDGAGATAVMDNGTTVDLANDVYYRANGTKYLMFTEPSLFELVQEKGES